MKTEKRVKKLEKVVGKYFKENKGKMPGTTTVQELMVWYLKQVK